MKLTKLQQERIEDIIAQEMRSLKEGWVAADDLSRSSKRREKNLFEGESDLERDLSPANVVGALEQMATDEANSCLVTFDNELLKHISSVLASHGLVARGSSSEDVFEMLAEYDDGAMTDAQMECASDITHALTKYIEAMMPLVLGAVGPGQE